MSLSVNLDSFFDENFRNRSEFAGFLLYFVHIYVKCSMCMPSAALQVFFKNRLL